MTGWRGETSWTPFESYQVRRKPEINTPLQTLRHTGLFRAQQPVHLPEKLEYQWENSLI